MALDFGIEIECLVPGRVTADIPSYDLHRRVCTGLAQAIEAAGLRCNFLGYTHRIEPGQWKIVTDSSIVVPPGYIGLEVVSPPLTDDTMGQVEIVCRLLNEMGAKVNRTCGLHVHVGARALGLEGMKRLAQLYYDHEEAIDGLLPPSRRQTNGYCLPMRGGTSLAELKAARDVQGIARAIRGGGRYVKLNYNAFFKFGTVEFRQHSGTVDATKITKWVFFCCGLVELARREGSAAPITQAQVQAIPEVVAQRLRRARQLRIILDAVSRPAGATSVEVQALLGRATPPALASDLNRIGVAFRRDGRRGGHSIYKLIAAPPPVTAPVIEDTTLPALLNKMALPAEDVNFWNVRAQQMSGTISHAETEAQ